MPLTYAVKIDLENEFNDCGPPKADFYFVRWYSTTRTGTGTMRGGTGCMALVGIFFVLRLDALVRLGKKATMYVRSSVVNMYDAVEMIVHSHMFLISVDPRPQFLTPPVS